MSNNIADRYANVKMQIEALEAELKMIKSIAIATGQTEIKGEAFSIKINRDAKRSSFDKDVLCKYLTKEQLDEATKVSRYEMVTYKAILPGASNDRRVA